MLVPYSNRLVVSVFGSEPMEFVLLSDLEMDGPAAKDGRLKLIASIRIWRAARREEWMDSTSKRRRERE